MSLVHLQAKTAMSSKPQLSDMSCGKWSKSPVSKLLNVFAIAPTAAELLGAQIGLMSKCDVLSPTERRSKSRDTDKDTDGDMDSNSTANQPFVRPQWPRSLAPVARPLFLFQLSFSFLLIYLGRSDLALWPLWPVHFFPFHLLFSFVFLIFHGRSDPALWPYWLLCCS